MVRTLPWLYTKMSTKFYKLDGWLFSKTSLSNYLLDVYNISFYKYNKRNTLQIVKCEDIIKKRGILC